MSQTHGHGFESSAICGVFLQQGLQQGNVPQTHLQPWVVELTTMGGQINLYTYINTCLVGG